VINAKTGLTKIFLIKNNIMAQKPFPEIKKKNRGKFTRWAKKNEFKSACSAATAVLAGKNAKDKAKKYSTEVIEMANYANNFGCKNKK